MNKVLISTFLLVSLLSGADKSNWAHSYKYTLKKDEVANVGVSTTESKGADKSALFFRWTSIVGDRVTVLLNHKGYQYILYKKRSLDRVKLSLLPDGSNRIEDKNYLILVLSDINHGKKEVDFDIFISDKKNRILVEF
jgi:hypothetical protein